MKLNNWFRIRNIFENIFIIKEIFYREHANIYLIKDDEEDLLIDTGTGIKNLNFFLKKFTKNTKVVNTHCHYDHAGGNKNFSTVFIHENGKEFLENPSEKNNLYNLIKDKDFLQKPDKKFKAKNYKMESSLNVQVLNNNDKIKIGNLFFKIIHTPGHSEDSICLWDKENGLLFSGDTYYKGGVYFIQNTRMYKRSLRKILKLKPKIVFPGHNNIMNRTKFENGVGKLLENLDQNIKKIYNLYTLKLNNN